MPDVKLQNLMKILTNEFKDACMKLYEDYEADGTWSEGLYDKIQEIIAG